MGVKIKTTQNVCGMGGKSVIKKLHTRKAKCPPSLIACAKNADFIQGERTDGQTDGRTKGNPISPFCNSVATGDNRNSGSNKCKGR